MDKILIFLLLCSCTKVIKKDSSYPCSESNLQEMKDIVNSYCVNPKDFVLVKECNNLMLQVKHFTHTCSFRR